MFFEAQGVEKSRTIKKILSKNEANMGIALGIDFSWISLGFGRQFGAKLASNIDKKTDPKKHQKHDAKKRHLDASWRRLGPVFGVLGGHAPRSGLDRGEFMGPPN